MEDVARKCWGKRGRRERNPEAAGVSVGQETEEGGRVLQRAVSEEGEPWEWAGGPAGLGGWQERAGRVFRKKQQGSVPLGRRTCPLRA